MYICRYVITAKDESLVDSEGKPSLFVKHAAREFNNPVIVLQGKNKAGPTNSQWAISTISAASSERLRDFLQAKRMGTIKRYIVRIVEQCGIPSHAEINFDKNLLKQIKNVKPTDILERPITDFKYTWDSANCKLVFEIGKFEICTFEIVIE